MKKLNWLHLSDFHFGKNAFQQELIASKILDQIESFRTNEASPDFIFITGDIANAGKPEEYEKFDEVVMKPLIQMLGENFKERIFVVPGNHDLNRKVNKTFSREMFLNLEDGLFEPTPESLEDRQMVNARFDNFSQQLNFTNSHEIFFEKGSFSQKFAINNINLGIAGINTSWLCRDEKDKGNLSPGIALVRHALEEIKDCDLKIVLGHHPLEWISPTHLTPIKSLFGTHNVIYLHGHMHFSWAEPSYGAGQEFLTIQTGAAYQAPEGSKWKNGLLWAKLDLNEGQISLQPHEWSHDAQSWQLAGGFFHEAHRNNAWWEYEIPKKNVKKKNSKNNYRLPGGWAVWDLDTLNQYLEPLESSEAISYFDGATPDWKVALSKSIPRREIVAKIKSTYISAHSSSESTVLAVLAAGCEGKTTALLQSSYEILSEKTEKKILIRTNNIRPFDSEQLNNILGSHDSWLIVIDEADQEAKKILHFIETRDDALKGEIDFLIASRDSDWTSSGASQLPWGYACKYKEVVLKDLSPKDADDIVAAWTTYGDAGLGTELAGLDHHTRVEKLRYYAKKESKGNSGAFFGALLLCRHGGDLLEHAHSMLERLDQVKINESKSLKDALGYIAAMHSENFDKLSFEALAAVLDLSVPKLQKEVIRKLGQEAAATTTATAIYTRHKLIADAIVEILETKYDKDITSFFIELALSELERSKETKILNINFWRFELADALFSSGKSRLAITLVEKLYEADQSNPFLLTKLAQLYRKNENPRSAIELIRDFQYIPKHRAFFFEWAVCEGTERNYLENALLATYAVSDDADSGQLTIDEAIMILNGLSSCHSRLYRELGDHIFEEASEATLSILNVLLTPRPSWKEKTPVPAFMKKVARKRAKYYEWKLAIEKLREAALHLKKYSINSQVVKLAQTDNCIFDSLSRLVKNVETSESRRS
ncbi:Calcineurin-like phosphoesterase [Pseudomonas sp. URMO17WK12:I11]|uniref:P-loop NTPase n=1 Tax=Pseudomonas sp. URMO17WK12:I11 TaxID=1283291 RepID=UPI000720CD18|nr:metallophosphoesterase [Pseudomonas sp. URMO17WK12:I11]CRN06144.1 Calcineurin-like phosphoesterase [Pseudomonas sp. URMO17WK12:I11]